MTCLDFSGTVLILPRALDETELTVILSGKAQTAACAWVTSGFLK